ncbi:MULTISPECIES: DUF4190 domain-containing protein [unclassified Nocardioides]|uniref:DUF4190 domain-containing protein n=1 Tax=unclassified Nocardioides TaxID=2615069 RepID=UPI001885BE38|nr:MULTISPECIES: DUF4190 domain-containing protein [unclassified Nocardioides]
MGVMTGPDEPRDDDRSEELPPTHQPYGQEPPPPPRPGEQPWSPPPPHQQSPYQQPYGAAPAYAAAPPPMHPQATTAMVLGIASLAGLVTCQLLLVLGPVAWVMGSRACQEIDAAPGRWQGRDRANAGRIMGIIGTVLLVLSVLAIAAMIVAVVAFGAFDGWESDTGVDVNALAALAGLG